MRWAVIRLGSRESIYALVKCKCCMKGNITHCSARRLCMNLIVPRLNLCSEPCYHHCRANLLMCSADVHFGLCDQHSKNKFKRAKTINTQMKLFLLWLVMNQACCSFSSRSMKAWSHKILWLSALTKMDLWIADLRFGDNELIHWNIRSN